MSTKLQLIAAAATACAASLCSAAVLTPGSSAGLDGWVSPGGTVVHQQTHAFQAIGVPLGGYASTGSVEQTIISQASGDLVFSLRISSLSAAPDTTLTSVLLAQWSGFAVDADFALGSGLSAPMDVARSAGSGDKIEWSSFKESLSDGKTSAWMQIASDAVGYLPNMGRLILSFSDGSVAELKIAAPSIIPAPGAAALVVSAAFCGIRRRR